jgi:teichuronic acid biosynthesis glycosyltransferase TuaG
MNSPLVSIILPLFNAGNFIQETLDSVYHQTYSNWELIVIDDGSTDRGPEIVQNSLQSDSRVILLKMNPPSGGPAAPRNCGISQAKGNFIAFLDSDDVWLPNKLEKQLKLMDQFPEIDIIGTNASIIPNGSGNSLLLFRDKRITFSQLLHAPLSFLGKTYVVNSSVLMRRSAAEAIGDLDTSPQLVASEDYDYWLRALKARDASVYVCRESLVKYRVHPNNLTGLSVRGSQIYDRLQMIYQKHDHPDIPKLLKRLPKLKKIHAIKINYYSGKISVFQVFSSEISFWDKLIVIFSKCVSKLHG